MKAELLAMLSAKGIDINNVPGGIPTITQQDVAAMLRKCTPCEEALLRTKYVGEKPHKAWAFWFEHLMEQGWEAPQGTVDRLSRYTLAEHLSDYKCGLCAGTRGWHVGPKWTVCPVCEGNGYTSISDNEIGSRVGVKIKGVWEVRLHYCRTTLQDWERKALANLRY